MGSVPWLSRLRLANKLGLIGEIIAIGICRPGRVRLFIERGAGCGTFRSWVCCTNPKVLHGMHVL
jgi:hypothetical protein